MTADRSSGDGFDEVVTLAQNREGNTAIQFGLTVVTAGGTRGSFPIPPGHPGRILVGQAPTCDLRVDDREVSRRHLALEPMRDKIRLTDLDSTNGTRVNGVEVVEAFLRGGERIQIGSTTLVVTTSGVTTQGPALSSANSFGRLLGTSEPMKRLYPLCIRLAKTLVPVVLEGETGTGKEVLAESLHEQGPRASGPFVVFDCTAVPANLIEAALFGHERGAFTGATDSRPGVFEEAHGGTLLIDEIGDLHVDLQAKLLRVLERSEVRRLGGRAWKKFDVRVLAATRRDLDHEVQVGRFRDDLFYRLAVTRIELPPLRRREGDIPLLASIFWNRLSADDSRIDPDFLQSLQAYSWPGNVRELQNAVARRVALGDLAPASGPSVGLASPRSRPSGSLGPQAGDDTLERILSLELPFPRARERMLGEFESRYVERILERHGGNVTRAAQASGLALRYFQLIRARNKADQ